MRGLNALERFELHHKIFMFVAMILATILFVRFAVVFYDPNPFVYGFELHHFDYGIIMLMILTILMLFDRSRAHYPLYLILTSISLGLIIDQLWFVRAQDLLTGAMSVQFYEDSSSSVVILFILIVLLTIFSNHKKRKHHVIKKP